MPIVLSVLGLAAVVLVVFFVMRGRSGSGSSGQSSSPGSAGAPNNLWLMGVDGDVKGKAFLVGNRTMTIGRAPTNLIQVDDDDISRMHTRVEPKDGYLQVIDLKSYNGTYIEGERLPEGRLAVGQTLRVGGASFRLELDADAIDSARDAKKADGQQFASTVAADSDDIAEKLHAALAETGGDFEEAARRLGADPDVLRHIATARGIKI